jgi:hypothetical protein
VIWVGAVRRRGVRLAAGLRLTEAGRRQGRSGDLVAEPGQGLLVVAGQVLVVAAVAQIVIVGARFGVVSVVLHHGPGDRQQGVRDSNSGLLMFSLPNR